MQANVTKVPDISRNGRTRAKIPMQAALPKSLFAKLFTHRFELPDWGRFKVTESGRFSMPYAMLTIMVTLCCGVIAALVAVGLAVAGAAIWVIIGITEVKTTVAHMAQEQQAQRTEIGGVRAYAIRAGAETDVIKSMLPEKHQAKVEQWERDNPVEKFMTKERN